MAIGIAGSFVGGGIMSLVGFYAYGFLANIMVSVLGACIFLYIAKKIFK
ncbi:GlsB/YeaQ/YmgE family stress response membrane protein [Blautia sp. RD014234]|nr:GlsB/YeaQ/YmgE family stress response membrane protein [Blautia parvula]